VTKRIRWIGSETLEFVNQKGISCYVKFKDPVYQKDLSLRKCIKERDILATIAIYEKCLDEVNHNYTDDELCKPPKVSETEWQ
jgi:hypothetical protein